MATPTCYEIATCTSCGRDIIWCKTPQGKRMPVDAEPVKGGNLRLEDVQDEGPCVYCTKAGEGTHVSHFATCPNAAQHRKPAPKQGTLPGIG